jgi:hypothetical protein
MSGYLHRVGATFKDLGRDVVGRAAHGLPPLSRMGQFGSQAKITDPNLQIISQQQVPQFQISMDDHLFLEILDGQRDLSQVVSGL